MIRSPVSTRRTGNKPPELVPQTGIFSRESSEEKEVPSTSSGSSGRSQIGAVRGNIPVDVRDAVSKVVGSGGKFLEPPKEVTAGRAGIQKLGDGAYKPFGPRSRSSSDAGSDTAFCDGGPGKSTCGEPVRHSDNGVSCDKCEKWFHTSCQAIPKPAFDALVKFKSLSWLCPPCKAGLRDDRHPGSENLASLESKVDQLERTVQNHLKMVGQSLKEQERTVENQSKLLERSIKDIQCQKVSYADMVKGACSDMVAKVTAKVTSIPPVANQPPHDSDTKNMAQMFDDFLDKDKRKNNIVIHNLPEAEGSTLQERIAKDISLFQELAKDTFRLNVSVGRGFRVGKAMPKKDRLLILTLDTPGVRQDLLRLAPELRKSVKWGKIYLTPDLTRVEREASRKLREELAARKAAGESNLTIRKGRIISTAQRAEAVPATPNTVRRVMHNANEGSSRSATVTAVSSPVESAPSVSSLPCPDGHGAQVGGKALEPQA